MLVCSILVASTLLSPSAWKCPQGVSVRDDGGALVFSIDAKSRDCVFVTADIPLPQCADASRRVRQEVDVENVARLVWGGDLQIDQIDAAGATLPESLADMREASHLRPVGKTIRYRDEGRIHPKAQSLRAKIELRRPTPDYGAGDLLRLSHLAVAAPDPSPKWDDSFFAPGVSGAQGDRSLVLGGEDYKAQAYQTRSRAAWSQMYQFRDEGDLYYPSGDGTVEAWFRPDVSKIGEAATLFDAYNGYWVGRWHAKGRGKGIGSVLKLTWTPKSGEMLLELKDWLEHSYSGKFRATLEDGRWSHVAVTLEVGRRAVLYVNGAKCGEIALGEYTALPLGDKTIVDINDCHATEFFLGAAATDTRLLKPAMSQTPRTFFHGAVDSFRASTGARYIGAFTPAKSFELDAATRALFTFDDGFDGVSGGGYGWIPATTYARKGRIDYQGRAPAEVPDEDNPLKVFDIVNYRDVPDEAEFREARRQRRRSATMKPGDTIVVDAPERLYMDYVEISNADGREPLSETRLVRKGRPDPGAFSDLRESMGLDGLSDREKVDRVFQYVIGASDYFMACTGDFAPGTDVPHTVIMDAMQMLNGYCGFECGPLNTMAANLFATVADCPSSVTFGYGHMFEQVWFDGKGHVYDLSAQKFFPCFDNRTSASYTEMGDEPGLFYRMGASPDHYYRKGTCEREVRNVDYRPRLAVSLNPGETFRAWAANDGQVNNIQVWRRKGHGARSRTVAGFDEEDYAKVLHADDRDWLVVRRDRIFPHFANAFLTFDGRPSAANPAFADEGAKGFSYLVSLPHPIVWGSYRAEMSGGGRAPIEMSTDGGRTYRPMPEDSEYMVKARHAYRVRVKAPIADVRRFSACTEVMVNPRVFPSWLKPGRNELTLKGSGGAAKVTVAWREPAKDIEIGSSFTSSGTIPGFERQVVAMEPGSGLELPVKGASSAAAARSFGPVKAEFSEGRLRLAYDASAPRLFRRGGDLPKVPAEFPAVAMVEIVDGDAVKPLTVIIAPGVRLLPASKKSLSKKGESATFRIDRAAMSGSKYVVFALARFPAQMDRYGSVIRMLDPDGSGKSFTIAKSYNGAFDYLKAKSGREGGRARWKWDTVVDLRKGTYEHNGWSMKTFELKTDTLKLALTGNMPQGVEIAALLLVPDPDAEARLDLRRMLFGLNCQPQSVKGRE